MNFLHENDENAGKVKKRVEAWSEVEMIMNCDGMLWSEMRKIEGNFGLLEDYRNYSTLSIVEIGFYTYKFIN